MTRGSREVSAGAVHEEICFLDAAELAARIRARDLSPVEVVRAHRERQEALNPTLNAIVTPFPDAEERARRAEAAVRGGERLGPLHGVPFTIKDSFDTAGVRTTRGSRFFADRVPEEDAVAVARLTGAGGIPLGKTNLPEFALWWETSNLVFGRTPNPWNPERTTGGSSGGEGAAIAAGLSPLGLGSDLGGSIRLPAHYCGIVGLKATHGRVPLTGHWPDTLLRYMHAGPMARSVCDVALALSVMAGPDGRDSYALAFPEPEVPGGDEPLPPLRVGWLGDLGFGPVDDEVVATVARAAEALAGVGAAVEAADVPGLEDCDANALTMLLYGAEAGPYFAPVIAGREDELTPALQRRLSVRPDSLPDYVAALADVERLRHALAAFFADHDVLLCPTAPVVAHPHELAEIVVRGEARVARSIMRATIPFDLTGSPALTVPFGWSADGLPIGVQLVGRHLDEGTLFRVGMALERARDGRRRRPPLVEAGFAPVDFAPQDAL